MIDLDVFIVNLSVAVDRRLLFWCDWNLTGLGQRCTSTVCSVWSSWETIGALLVARVSPGQSHEGLFYFSTIIKLKCFCIFDVQYPHANTNTPVEKTEYVCNKYSSNILLVCLLYFCHQILPSAVDMLREFPGQNLRISLPCIQFIYWALIHVENCAGQQVIEHLLNLVFNEMANLASFYNWHLTVRLVLRFNR